MSSVWPILHYDDTELALGYLVEVLGFAEEVVARDAEGRVVHAEMSWPGGGRLVFGSTSHEGGVHEAMRAGTSACYVVTDRVDEVHRRVVEDGRGEVARPPGETRFGSGAEAYAFTAADPEGNLWTFGTYPEDPGLGSLRRVGTVESPLADTAEAPRQPDEGAPAAWIAFDPDLAPGLDGLRAGDEVLVLTWLGRARRDRLTIHPRGERDRPRTGVFNTRTPHRPNPIGLHQVTITAIEGARVRVDGLEAIDGTAVLDLKPVLGPIEQR